MSSRESVSVVIATKDVAHLIDDCLQSVTWADEVIVVDMHSTDDTKEICASYRNVCLYSRDDYIFGNMNFGFNQVRSQWTLRLDSDERISPELATEIEQILRDPPSTITGYEFPQQLVILGHVLKYGRARDPYRKMMFRTGSAHYAVQSEHEELSTCGRWVRLRHPYVHLNYVHVDQYLIKTNYYTTRDVERMELADEAPAIREGIVATLRAFYLYYLKKQGFRDGWPGFIDAGMMAIYQFVQWAKLTERWHGR